MPKIPGSIEPGISVFNTKMHMMIPSFRSGFRQPTATERNFQYV
jgi:hypothetical protein